MKDNKHAHPLQGVILASIFAYGAWNTQDWMYTHKEWALMPYLCAFFAAWLSVVSLFSLLFFVIPQKLRYRKIFKGSNKAGSASWTDPRRFVKKHFLDIFKFNKAKGFFVGGYKDSGIFVDIESSGLVLSPAGGGKTVSFVIPALCHNPINMIVPDLKGTLSCMCAKMRKKQFGHTIITVNPAGLYQAILGKASRYNPLIILIDNWETPALHVHLFSDEKSIAQQLCPEPSSSGENQYWRNGSRKFLVFAFLYLVSIDNQNNEANLSAALNLLSDPKALEAALVITACSSVLQGDLARLAKDVLAKIENGDPKQIESFIGGAVQVLEVFPASGTLAESTSTCDFRFSDLRDKKKKTSIFLIADPTRMAVYAPWLGLLSWCAMTELIRKANGVPVCFLCDEITNFKIEGLPSLITLAREFKIILWLIVQELDEWSNTYGRQSLETLLSQTEVKIIMGSRNYKTCQLISDMLGEYTHVSQNYNLGHSFFENITSSVSESGRKLLTADEVRRTEKIILFYRNQKPALLDKIGYHEVRPWSKRVGINPLFGKKFKGKTKLKL